MFEGFVGLCLEFELGGGILCEVIVNSAGSTRIRVISVSCGGRRLKIVETSPGGCARAGTQISDGLTGEF